MTVNVTKNRKDLSLKCRYDIPPSHYRGGGQRQEPGGPAQDDDHPIQTNRLGVNPHEVSPYIICI